MEILLPKPPRWTTLTRPGFGLMNTFSKIVQKAYQINPEFLPDLQSGQTIWISSDYSGDHKKASFKSISFLFADLESCYTWEGLRKKIREKHLPDERRMSFKRLGDKFRDEALLPFLSAADTIPGLSVTILIDKRIKSFFTGPGSIDMTHPELTEMQHWKPEVLEKLLRILHFAAFFLSGLSRPGQDVLWVTDDDSIAPNDERVAEVTHLFGNIVSHYLEHDLRHLKFGTASKTDDGSKAIEDLISVPDLIAGALVQIASIMKLQGCFPGSQISIALPENALRKTKNIMRWFSDKSQHLKRAVYVIEPSGEGKVTLKDINFHGYGTMQ